MNRAERRATERNANKKQPRDNINKRSAWIAMNTMIVKRSVADNDDEAKTLLIAPAYAALDALTGTATSAPWIDDSGFIGLNEMNVFGFQLAKLLHQDGTPDTRALLAPTEVVFATAANALAAIGTRKNQRGKYRATGDELNALRESFALLGQLVEVAPQGHTLSALIEAAQMVDQYTRKAA